MNLPNKLTLTRLILIPFFIAAFYAPFPGHYFVALGIFCVASLTDFFDGHIARKYNLVTDLGKFMDPIADKVLVLATFVVMLADPYTKTNVFLSVGNPGLIAGGIGVSIIVAREMAVSSLRMMAAKKGLVLAAEKSGKIKTFFTDISLIVLLVAAGLGDLPSVGYSVFYASSVAGLVCFGISVLLTVYSGISYLVKNASVFGEDK